MPRRVANDESNMVHIYCLNLLSSVSIATCTMGFHLDFSLGGEAPKLYIAQNFFFLAQGGVLHRKGILKGL